MKAIAIAVAIAAVNFIAFVGETLIIGGDALNGHVENGQYFVSDQGQYTEVSRAVWIYSFVHGISMMITHLGVFVTAGIVILRSETREVEMPPIAAPRRVVPWVRFVIDVDAPRDRVFATLADNVEPRRRYRDDACHAAFEGLLDPPTFKINRAALFMSSSVAVICGRIDPAPGGSRVIAQMRLHRAVGVLVTVWCVVLSGFAALFASGVVGLHRSIGLIPAAIALFGYGVVLCHFWGEVKRSHPLLIDVLTGDANTRGTQTIFA